MSIIYPGGYSPATPLTHGRIGIQSYTRGATAAQVIVSTEHANGPRDAPLRPDLAEFWRPTGLPATWKFDIGSVVSVNYVGIAGHDLGTNGCTVLVETSDDDETYEDLAQSHAPADDSPIMLLDDARDTQQVLLTITGAGGVPSISSIYIGLTVDMPRPIYGGVSPLMLSRETQYRTAMSQGGQFLGRTIQRMGVRGTVNFKHLLASWYRSTFDPMVAAPARLYPFFYAWRPSSFPAEVVYIWALEDMVPMNSGIRSFMEVSAKVQGIGYAT